MSAGTRVAGPHDSAQLTSRAADGECMSHRARGAATVEYAVLLGTVGIGAAVAFLGLAVALVDNFDFVRRFVLYPYP